jgi:DNA invertase Pin-like site-specific DNA recombinase
MPISATKSARNGRGDAVAACLLLGETWADTTTAHGRLMLTVLGGLAPFIHQSSQATRNHVA